MPDLSSAQADSSQSYINWLADWTSHISNLSTSILVPHEAARITTPLNHTRWQFHLSEHPDKALIKFFISGITQGFRLGFNNPLSSLKSARNNLDGALQHPAIVEEYIAEEITQHRVVGPFSKSAVPRAHISRFGVIPKRHTPNKWRLIVDLSHPAGHSVNDGIPKSLCSLSYVTVDTAIRHILDMGPGALLAKMDVKHAFRLLPVHPADRHLLAMCWKGDIFIDTCLPFGLRSAPKLFNTMADLLSWILERKGVSPLIHYLDDFLTMGPADSQICLHHLTTIKETCQDLGIPLAFEKLEGPSHCLTFLGIILDTQRMEARLPPDKLSRIRNQLSTWLSRKKATKREVLSLVGLLQHACKVVRPGRLFVSQMYSTAAKLKHLSHHTRLNKEFRSNLHWWHTFVTSWNGTSLFHAPYHQAPFDSCIQTDASGSWGCGAFLHPYWFQYAWPSEWSNITIMAKELVPIIISCAVWGPLLTHKHIQFQCDNQSLVSAINKGSAKDNMVMHLLRCLWFFTASFDIQITATHLPGTLNKAADMLSRNQSKEFLTSHPKVSRTPTTLPPPLLNLLSPQKLDWTSPSFLRHFTDTLTLVQPHLKTEHTYWAN